MNDDMIVPIAITAIVFGVPFLAMIIMRALKVCEVSAKHANEVRLKMKMVEKGYSADEIERVCRMPVNDRSSSYDQAWQTVVPKKPAKV